MSASSPLLTDSERKFDSAGTVSYVFKRGKMYEQINGRLIKQIRIGCTIPNHLMERISKINSEKSMFSAELQDLVKEAKANHNKTTKEKFDKMKFLVSQLKELNGKEKAVNHDLTEYTKTMVEARKSRMDGADAFFIQKFNVLIQDGYVTSQNTVSFSYDDHDEISGNKTITHNDVRVLSLSKEQFAQFKVKIKGEYVKISDLPQNAVREDSCCTVS